MTARAPFTQATVRKAIAAAQKSGLHVHGIRADGTVIVGENAAPPLPAGLPNAENASPSKWEDVEA